MALTRDDIKQMVYQEAVRQGVDPTLATRLAYQESRFNPEARSKAGAIGPLQLMPGTAKDLGVDPYDPMENVRGGITYLKQQLDRFKDPRLALAAYNAGPGAVLKYGDVPPFKETQHYVQAILGDAGGAPAPGVVPWGGAVAPRTAERSAAPVRDWWQAPTEEGVAPLRVTPPADASLEGEQPPPAPTPRAPAPDLLSGWRLPPESAPRQQAQDWSQILFG
jgi:Transglycosylase SLT domain